MEFHHRRFELEIASSVDSNKLDWPRRGEAGHDSALGMNRLYEDLRFYSWKHARDVRALESELIARIESAVDPEQEAETILDELYEADDHLFGLDLGVASAVIGLSAARCLPFTSCNAGAFGGTHAELYPLVAFYAKKPMVPLLLRCCEDAGVGLENSDGGSLTVYSADIPSMLRFADSLIARRHDFQAIRLRPPARRTKLQVSLPFAE